MVFPRLRIFAVEIILAALTLGALAFNRIPIAQAQSTDVIVGVLRNITYPSEFAPDKRAALRDGKYAWEQPPQRGSVTFADAALGAERTAVLLSTSTGGPGVFLTLHLITTDNGTITAGPGLLLGDRQRVDAFTVIGDRARIGLITQGRNEPLCCPTQRETRDFLVDGKTFRLVSTTVTKPAKGSAGAPRPPKPGNLGRLSEVGALPPVLAAFTLAFAVLARAASHRGMASN